MPYLTKEEVEQMLKERRHDELIDEHLITGLPYVFRDNPEAYQAFANTLASELRTPLEDISLIGSARIGYSLDPDKFGTPFQPESDLDAVVINAAMFDTAWFQLYNFGRRRLNLRYRVKTAFDDHRRNNVFYGFIVPKELPGVLTAQPLWFNALQRVGADIRVLAGHDVNGRLYRTWNHVKAHQRYSLNEIAASLRNEAL
jgi:hypothetical protein